VTVIIALRWYVTAAIAAVVFVLSACPPLPAGAASQETSVPNGACASGDPAFTNDDLSGITAPCATARGDVTIETLYFQNASRVGGTALAAYPMVRVRTGVLRRLEAVLDAPSQVAESGLNGAGQYPMTHLGYGLNYTALASARLAAGFGAEFVPPASLFAVTQAQPKYVFDATAGYRLSRRATVSALATGASSHSVGFERVFPSLALRETYDTSATTQISTDLGARIVTRHERAQSFGDVAVNERLRKNLGFSVGLGTAFNPINDTKAHYLASGFNLHL
jgi:hypothetical protein